MPVTILVGAQWGDEGKGKIIDALAPTLQMVVRYQGGPNAGHTVIVDGEKLVLHQVPTGVLHAGVACAIAAGVLLDPWELAAELDGLAARGLPAGSVRVSSACHLILPWHRRLDQAREAALARQRGAAAAIGTTGRGIGPCAVDKAGRRGLRLGDLLDASRRRRRLEEELPRVNAELAALGEPGFELATLEADCAAVAERLRPQVADVRPAMEAVLRAGGRILMEGAQGALLDVDWGTYPYVTSTSPVAGGACTGGGVPVTAVDQVIGIAKVYATRVGNGPFPTEFPAGEFADGFRQRAGEFGATTGRPRRCGWFDLPAMRHSARVNGFTELVLTKFDVLDDLGEIQLATAYRLGGETLRDVPEDLRRLEDGVEPVYETLPGWRGSAAARGWDELPAEALAYVARLEAELGARVGWISNGPGRERLIRRP